MNVASLTKRFRQALPFLREQRQWIPLALAYVAAWWLPITWIWALFHPGAARPEGIDGPVSWLWKGEWGSSESPNSFQFLIPIGVALLTWIRRAELEALWQRILRREREGRPLPNRKTPLIACIACLGLLASHLIHLPALAIASLIALGVGIVCLVYGTAFLTALRVPLLYWLLMVPPPASLITVISKIVSAGTIRIAVVTLRALGKSAAGNPPQLLVGGVSSEIGGVTTLGAGGASILTLTAALALTFGLYRREPAAIVLTRVGVAALLGLLLNVARVDLAMLVRAGGNSALSDQALALNVWFLVVPVTLLVCCGEGLARKLKKSKTKGRR